MHLSQGGPVTPCGFAPPAEKFLQVRNSRSRERLGKSPRQAETPARLQAPGDGPWRWQRRAGAGWAGSRRDGRGAGRSWPGRCYGNAPANRPLGLPLPGRLAAPGVPLLVCPGAQPLRPNFPWVGVWVVLVHLRLLCDPRLGT